MSVPTRQEAAFLLLSLDPPPWHVRHSRAVAEVAGWLAARAAERSPSLDRRLIETAALLHDADKLPAVRAAVADRPHGQGSATWLERLGHPELGPAVAGHPVTRLADDAWFERWLRNASEAEILVAYADKRAGQRLESMAARFASWRRRYPPREAGGGSNAWPEATIETVERRAAIVEARAAQVAGVEPAEVGRLRWTAAALRAARRADTGADGRRDEPDPAVER